MPNIRSLAVAGFFLLSMSCSGDGEPAHHHIETPPDTTPPEPVANAQVVQEEASNSLTAS